MDSNLLNWVPFDRYKYLTLFLLWLKILRNTLRYGYEYKWGSPHGSVVKNPLPMQEMGIQSLGWEDFLEREMATHSSFLAWRIPWTQEPARPQRTGSQRVGHGWATKQQQPQELEEEFWELSKYKLGAAKFFSTGPCIWYPQVCKPREFLLIALFSS